MNCFCVLSSEFTFSVFTVSDSSVDQPEFREGGRKRCKAELYYYRNGLQSGSLGSVVPLEKFLVCL